MKKFYLLDNDYLFKQIFKDEKYLKHLLKTFFNVSARKIEYLNTELIKDNCSQKVGIVDLLLKVDGKITILELQNIDRHNFKKRLLFYSSSVIAKYCLKTGEDYDKLRPIRVYAIINYQKFNNKVLDTVKLKNDRKTFTNNLRYKIFDLTQIDSTHEAYELVSLFKGFDTESTLKNEINKEILDKIKIFNLDWKEYQKMDDIAQMMMNETEHYETAERVGVVKGKRIGMAKGKKIGIAEGKIEKQNEIAKNLLHQKININIISQATGLTNKQILALK